MYFDLFLSFAKIGAFTLGGGYAMVPLIQNEVVEKKGWVEKQEFLDILAVAQSTPGALAVNVAVYIGYKIKGILGAFSALVGCVLPSFFSILIIAMFFTNFLKYNLVKKFFLGVRPAVAALIFYSAFKIAKTSKLKKSYYIITLAAVALMFLKLDPIVIIFLSAIVGILLRGAGDGN